MFVTKIIFMSLYSVTSIIIADALDMRYIYVDLPDC